MQKCGEKSSMGKRHSKKHLIPINVLFALVLFFFTVVNTAAADWSCIWTYHEYRDGNIQIQANVCVRLEQSRTDESYGRSGYRTIYVLVLKDGTKLGIYKKLADQIFSTRRMEDLDFLKNQEFTFKYIPKRIFTDGSYVLISISDGSEFILDECDVFSYYWDRLLTNLILSCIFDGIALLLVIVPPIYRLVDHSKKQAKKRHNKQKKLQKKLQTQQKRASQNQDERKG